ncbi:unnamed protein product [Phyllotreta striolata]|uniref:Uncharacterized protein n=1 Tax=Phyllotreta striolata TaxID=444603 RepID=A0A9N9TF25_PHYSR|nr:unnamed protein product [Phyllotreta striolata]
MFSTKIAVVCLLHVIVAVSCDDPVKPVWSEKYLINGMIHYPDTEIKEFFDMWYDSSRNASRIDFYGGSVKYYQLGNGNGVQYKIVPVTTEEVLNERTCFQIDGTAQNPIGPQAMFPNMDELEYRGLKVNQMGKQAECYETEKEIMGTNHKYTLWVNRDAQNNAVPVYYELAGHNTLMPPGPTDVVDIVYFKYTPVTDIPADVFNVSNEGLKCKPYPGPASHKVHAFNPVADIIHPQKTEHVEARFKEFVNTHGKQYESDDEHSFRKLLFRRNVRYIEAVNRQNKSYTLGVNHLADRTDEEMQVLRGRISSDEVDNEGLPFPYENPEAIIVPDEHDWRLYGAVTSMKDQAHCSSCWAFGVIAALEGAYFLKTGELKILSEQAVMDCAWGFGNNGCHGGSPKGAYQWIKKHNGVPATDEYGKYLGENANCRADLSNNTNLYCYRNLKFHL